MKKKLVSLMAVGAAVFGMFVFQIPAAESASAATTHNRVCKVVTVPASLPWYQCLGNTFTPGTQNNPPGCYSSKKTVCS